MSEPYPGWPRLAGVFDELLDLEPAQRGARLRALREETAEFAAELSRLLAADAEPGVLDLDLSSALAARAAEPVDDGEDLSGLLAGAYRLTCRIGSGGMGTVYAAVRADGLYEQRVAVKVLSHVGSPDLLRRFARERAILATLEHPHIARLLDAGALDGRPFLVMELVEGANLIDHCDQQRADLAARLRLFLQVCAAVGFAHRRLVVHRDLKPSNVQVAATGEVKLLDFGIASLLDAEIGEVTATSTRRVFTPAYAAPEQVYGQVVTTATDVFALGALLHELLVGRPPQPGWQTRRGMAPSLTTTLDALTAEESGAAAAARGLDRRGLARRVRGDLEAIVATALRPEPEQRYGSVGELAEDVERYLTGRPVVARGQHRLYRARLFVRRHRGSLAASALALVGLMAALWVALAQAREARSEALRAGAFRRFLSIELKRELVEAVPTGPDGPTLGYLLDHGLREVDRNLAREPEVAAEIFSIAGETFRMIGADERAVGPLRAAVVRKRALYGEGDPRLRAARLDLAHALVQADRAAEAGPLLALVEGETRGGDAGERYDVMNILGEQRQGAGDLAGAMAARREALALLVSIDGGRSSIGLDQRNHLATLQYLAGKYGDSERTIGEAIAVGTALGKVKASARPKVAFAWMQRAYARQRLGDLEGARLDYRRARQGLAAVPADFSEWSAAYVSCGWGLLLAEAGEGEAARALLTSPEVAGADPNHPWTLGFGDPGVPCPALAAWARDDLAGFDRALAASKGALREATRPDRDLLRAEMLLARGRAAEALPLCGGAVRVRDSSGELQPWRRAEAHLLRGLALCRLGRRAEGQPEVARAATTLRDRLPRHRYLRLAEETLAQ